MISIIQQESAAFEAEFAALLRIPEADQKQVRGVVENILADVRERGDEALVEYTNRFDGQTVSDVNALRIQAGQLEEAFKSIEPLVAEALEESVARVREYHEQQLKALGGGKHWQYQDEFGNALGQRIRAMERVGLYAPGGKAAYPSTVIMTAIPAKVAGVEELILCVPTPGGELNATLLAAAHLCDIDHVFAIGGAQAIGAMAFGTQSVPRVDKIVGPGNIYVATAKELVFGEVGIDMIAGPSEVLIVADGTADAAWVIQDMFAQAEHDEMAQSIVVTDSEALLQRIQALLPVMLAQQSRRAIIAEALSKRGALILVPKLDDAFDIVNRIAPEHLQLSLQDPEKHLDKVKHAGAIFLGMNTAEVVGDYTAGPSHVLPTSGTARFASPLGVYDFQTRTSVIQCSRDGAIHLNRAAAIIAAEEGLDAHAESALSRVRG